MQIRIFNVPITVIDVIINRLKKARLLNQINPDFIDVFVNTNRAKRRLKGIGWIDGIIQSPAVRNALLDAGSHTSRVQIFVKWR